MLLRRVWGFDMYIMQKIINSINYRVSIQMNRMKYVLNVGNIRRNNPHILTSIETIEKIIKERCSLSRFGDGEFYLMLGLNLSPFQKLVNQMIEYHVDISCCQYDRCSCFSGEATEAWNRDVAMKNFLVHKQINGSLVNKLFKRKLIKGKRLDESIKYGEDALFLWKNLFDVSSIAVSPDVLYHVTLHDDSASGGGSYKPIRRDCIRVWKLISQDAVQVSAELGRMARAQLGNMAFFSLYEMGYYGCKNEEHQKEYLNTLRNTIMDLCNADFIPFGEKCLAHVFLNNILLGRILIFLKRKIKKILIYNKLMEI